MTTPRGRLRAISSTAAALVWFATRPPPCAAEPDLAGLETFVDGAVAGLSMQRIAGVHVAVVLNGVPILVKGYGLSALAPARPVDPQRTLFRLGSISKTFTWLALMQLVEHGKLRLEDPVNAHLPARLAIPTDGWSKPVRVIDLMNHTAGFEDTGQPGLAGDDTGLRPLADQLHSFRPARVREPGQISVYSNYGAALAGEVVAHESGVDFETYVEQHILEPLQMKHTTFREPYGPKPPRGVPQPMPKALENDRASAIEWDAGAWKAFPHMHVQPDAPAGAASSTAADMASYMSALLDPALLERTGVLRRSTYAVMVSESFRPAPGLRAIHHGFFDVPARAPLGYANLSHNGFVAHFASSMQLFPELGLGVYAASNSASGDKISGMLSELILQRYFPPQQSTAATKPRRADLSEYAGEYRWLRRSYTKLEAVFSIAQTTRIAATPDGYLVVGDKPDQTSRFARVEGDLFQKVDGDARLAFVRDASHRIVRVLGALNSDRVALYQTLAWLRGWLLASGAAACAVLAAAWRRRRRKIDTQGGSAWSNRAARLLTLTAAAWLSFHVAAFVWEHRYANSDVWEGYPQPVLRLALSLLMAAVSLTAVSIALLPGVWRGNDWKLGRRVRHTAVVLVLLMTSVTVQQWNALGFKWF